MRAAAALLAVALLAPAAAADEELTFDLTREAAAATITQGAAGMGRVLATAVAAFGSISQKDFVAKRRESPSTV